MHFALPPRKSSHPPPYAARSSRSTVLRRTRLQFVAIFACCIIVLIIVFTRLYSTPSATVPLGTPEVVIVTTLDENGYSQEYIEQIKANRQDYAARHGYACFLPKASTYDLKGSPITWARIPAVRHALTLYPHSSYFFFLDQQGLITNPSLSISDHIVSRSRLESLMLKDVPVVPPDSVIKTFSHLKGDQVDLILTQDKEGLAQGSFIIRQGDWAQFFLDSWFDPLYRSYNFQRAEGHALEHVVQWHPTILSKLVLVPQRTMNSYDSESAGGDENRLYKAGDFVVRLSGCDAPDAKRSCDGEMAPHFKEWQTRYKRTSQATEA
ncbi:MAG: hypothetical protein M1812_005014 [Candelaria pacifica]|nr:MAG: hypothetical protein M1812_005014 [Candelaria pacifica]